LAEGSIDVDILERLRAKQGLAAEALGDLRGEVVNRNDVIEILSRSPRE
jgi:hypothetical protein